MKGRAGRFVEFALFLGRVLAMAMEFAAIGAFLLGAMGLISTLVLYSVAFPQFILGMAAFGGCVGFAAFIILAWQPHIRNVSGYLPAQRESL